MKAILISDHAKWCALMMNGKKKVEVRKGTALYKATKKLIDEYGYAEFCVYCTKNKVGLYDNHNHITSASDKYFLDTLGYDKPPLLNGKAIFKFRCYKVEQFTLKMIKGGLYFSSSGSIDFPNEEAQLDNFELLDYAGEKLGTKICAIHISDLEIFDKPKELSEFYYWNVIKNNKYIYGEFPLRTPLTKAPQNFCYVEVVR